MASIQNKIMKYYTFIYLMDNILFKKIYMNRDSRVIYEMDLFDKKLIEVPVLKLNC